MINDYNPYQYETPPLCGIDWLRQHKHDHTQAEIESLGMSVSVDGCKLPEINSSRGHQQARRNLQEIIKGD